MPLLDLGAKNFTKPLPDGLGPVGWRLLAYLSWPTNQQKRDEFLATLNAKSGAIILGLPQPEWLQDAYPDISTDDLDNAWKESKAEAVMGQILAEKEPLNTLADAPGMDALLDETRKNTVGWTTASHIFFAVYTMDKFHASELRGGASVSKAVDLLENHFRATVPGNRKDIMNCWRDFKPVSHLGAALNIFSVASGGNAATLGKMLGEDPGRILSIAKVFQDFGLGFKAHGQSASILPADATWIIPDNFSLPSTNLNLRPLSPANLKFLKEYRAPIKT